MRTFRRLLKNYVEVVDDVVLTQTVSDEVLLDADGGIISYRKDGDNIYRSHTFLNSGSFKVNTQLSAYIFIVGGGGGGGGRHGGGGGGGGIIAGNIIIYNDVYPIIIGQGGKGAFSDTTGYSGEDTTFLGETAIGGGGGGAYGGGSYPGGANGGCGGAGGHAPSVSGSSIQTVVDSNLIAYGNDGGSGGSNEGGGGGGAGAVGQNASGGSYGGAGGDGIQCPVDGYWYAGGGGGGGWTERAGAGGRGGGGCGGRGNSTGSVIAGDDTGGNDGRTLPFPGQGASGGYGNPFGGHAGVNTGGGGGGSGQRDNNSYCGIGGDGGSGIVIIEYQIA